MCSEESLSTAHLRDRVTVVVLVKDAHVGALAGGPPRRLVEARRRRRREVVGRVGRGVGRFVAEPLLNLEVVKPAVRRQICNAARGGDEG